VLSKLDLKTMTVTMNAAPAGSVGDDPVIRKFGNLLYVVNRADGNNVTILDATTLALVEQLGTGAGSNPQDVAVEGDDLFVPVYSGTGVVVLHRGKTTFDTIDLGMDDPDGHPDCNAIYAVDTNVYVSCELLDARFAPRGPGKVYVIDASTHAVTKTIAMMNKNPFGVFEAAPGNAPIAGLVTPTVDFSDGSGCVEQISTDVNSASKGCLPTNAQLMGSVERIDFAQLPDQSVVMLMAVAASDFMHANLQGYDLAGKTLWAAPLSPATEKIGDVTSCPNGDIVVSDTTMATNGLRVYGGDLKEITTAALPVGLSPLSSHGLVCY
jgi:YVTN family beta-propeller protein